ncbi:hypothetical protein BaRGS_00013442, partial [Batillaria attramentaria]
GFHTLTEVPQPHRGSTSVLAWAPHTYRAAVQPPHRGSTPVERFHSLTWVPHTYRGATPSQRFHFLTEFHCSHALLVR